MKRFLAWLCAWMVRLPGYTLRVTTEDRAGIMYQPDHAPMIIAFWHNRTMLMPFFYERYSPGRTIVMFISRSRDGQFVTDAASFFGN